MQQLGRVCRRHLRVPNNSSLRDVLQQRRTMMDRPPPPRGRRSLLHAATATALTTGLLYMLVGRHLVPGKRDPQSFNDAMRLANTSGGASNDAAMAELQGFRLRDRFNFINKVVERCAPAVVYVEIRDTRKIDKETDNPLIVSNGSGFIVSEDGWILTNAHVVINKPQANVQVKLQNGKSYTATVENADMNIDLALIKINANEKLPALHLAKSGDVSVGEWVVALGSPLSLSHSATAGVVSCVNRAADELGLRNYQMRYIQTDAPITFGNSGGPLVNLDGEVIGINNLRITAGISFAIPVEFVQKYLDRIKYINANKVAMMQSSNNIGITTITMNSEIVDDVATKFRFLSGDIKDGVLVWKVIKDSIGEKAGILVGDVVTHVNGKPVNTTNDLYQHMVNGKNKIQLRRNGSVVHIDVHSV